MKSELVIFTVNKNITLKFFSLLYLQSVFDKNQHNNEMITLVLQGNMHSV